MKLNKFLGAMMAVAAFAAMAVSCQPDTPQGGGEDVEHFVTVEADTLYFGYEASEETLFYVESHDAFWEYSYDENQEWCSVSDITDEFGNRTFAISVVANTTGADRELTITITNGDAAGSFVVKQYADLSTPATAITLNETNFVLNKEMTTISIVVEADGDYEVVIPEECDWISREEAVEADGKITESFFVAGNFGEAERNATITFKSLNTTATATIKQWGNDDLSVEKNEITVAFIAGQESVAVVAGSEYTVTVEGEWVTINEELSTEGVIVFDYTANESEEDSREATIIVATENSTEEIVVTQIPVSNTDMPAGDQWLDDLAATITAEGSQMSTSRGVLKAVDGNIKSNWFSATNGTAPQELVLNVDASNIDRIDYLKYVPVSGTMIWGRWGEIDVYVTDAEGKESLVKSANFEMKGVDRKLTFEPALPNTTTKVRVVIKTAEEYVANSTTNANVASAAEVGLYMVNPDAFQILDYFDDMAMSKLRSDITYNDITTITDPFYRSIAERMFFGTYDDEFRVCEFKAYPRPERDYEIFRDKPFSMCSNVTGMFVPKAGTPQYIYLDEDYGLEIYVRVVDLKTYSATKNPYGTGPDDHTYDYKLQKGRNVIVPAFKGLMYILAFDDENYQNIPPMKAHFVNSGVNGYIDYNKHTVEDVYRIFMLAPQSEELRFDMVTEHALLNFEKAQYLKGTFSGNPRMNPQGAIDLLEVYDSVTKIQERIMGHEKYKALGLVRGHRNRMLFMGAYGDTFGYSAWYHTGYSAAMSSDVVRPLALWNKNTQNWNNGVVGAIWGIAHELGHSTQTDMFCWQGLAEVTNNLMCAITQNYVYGVGLGRTTMRYNDHFNKGMRDMAKRWIWDFKKDESGNIVSYERPVTHSEACNIPAFGNIDGGVDPTTQLMPFYQLFLYYHLVMGNSDFYPDFYELCRTKGIVKSQFGGDHDLYQSALALEYMKSISEAAGEDLSDWACEWGLPGINPGFGVNKGTKVNHYGQAFFCTTAEQVQASVDFCKQYPKPKLNPLYINDLNLDLYRNPQAVTAGTHTVDDNGNFKTTGWENVVAWVLHDPEKLNEQGEKGRDVAVIMCKKATGNDSFQYGHKESRYMVNDAGDDYRYNNGSSYASNDKGTMRALEKVTPDYEYTKTLQLYAVDAYGKRYASQSNN